jgi:hypothetical protein
MHNSNRHNITGEKGPASQAILKTERIAVAALLFYFISQAFYFAFSVGENIFPDEISRIGLIEIFSRSLLPPADSPESARFGLIKTFPILYFFLMGKFLSLNFLPVSNLVFLRCVNIFIGTLTIWFGWKFIRLLVSETVVRLLFFVMITNTLMYTFTSASVSYDNLTNFFAILSIYYLFSFFQFRGSGNFLVFVLFVLLGLLTKFTFLPYSILLLSVFLFHERKNLRSLRSATVSLFSPIRWKNCLLLIFCLFFMAANANLYLGNLLKYGKIQPDMDKVVGLEQALQYRIFARDYVVRLFREGKISHPEARNMAIKHIKHTGDLYGALMLLEQNARENALKKKPRIDLFRYAFVWTDLMMGRIFGVMGHRSIIKRGIDLVPYLLLLLLSSGMLIRRIKAPDLQGTSCYLLFISVAYALTLMLLVNYKLYLGYGIAVADLQGRYIFPVIVPIYTLSAFYLAGFGSKQYKWVIFIIVTAIFVYGGFPWFVQRVTPDWFFQ